MVTKQQLTERGAMSEGTLVRLVNARPSLNLAAGAVVVVKDLFERKSYSKPDRIGVGPLDRGIAFSVSLDEIELA